MRCKGVLLILAMIVLTSCHDGSSGGEYCVDNSDIDAVATRHKAKLRQHFIRRVGNEDISALISETRSISSRLKRTGRTKEANKFDSYTDVLMFGNKTLGESLNDVMKLVRNPEEIHNSGDDCDNCGNCANCKTLLSKIFNFRCWDRMFD